MLLGEKVEHVLQVGSHGTTYGGNPIMCAVALKAFEKLKSPTLLANVLERSEQAFIALNRINDELNIFSQIRGRGLMIGAELIPSLHGKAPEISEGPSTQEICKGLIKPLRIFKRLMRPPKNR